MLNFDDSPSLVQRIDEAITAGGRKLDLSACKLTSLPPRLWTLTELRSLSLDSNNLSALPDEFRTLRRLEHLSLGGNSFNALPPQILACSNLRHLNLSGNALLDLDPGISALHRLEHLDLSYNRLASLPESLCGLAQLRVLELHDNQLAALPGCIGRLNSLEHLGASSNQLRRLPPQLSNVSTLVTCSAAENQLSSLPAHFGRLRALQQCDFSNNSLTSIPESIGQCEQLTQLDLSFNKLKTLPESFCKLRILELLYLGNNCLVSLPDALGSLERLSELYIDNNRLRSLPPGIGDLQALRELYANDNALSTLPPSLADLSDLSELDIDGNPLPEPFFIAYRRGFGDLIQYLGSLGGEREQIYEAKLLFVGEGNVGQSSLLGALLGEPFVSDRPTTHGIEIRPLVVDHPRFRGVPIKLNCWDFGGQAVYRVTHQFFFSQRALYLLVWRPREGVELNDVEGWIRRIRLRAGLDARVLVVASHCQSDDRIPRIDEPGFRERFGPTVAGFFEIDSKTGFGIEALRAAICEAAAKLPHMGEPFSTAWRSARAHVMRSTRAHIRFSSFARTCRRYHVSTEASLTLAKLMHDLGDIVYFPDDAALQEMVVLKPEWLTKAIGFVLEDGVTNREAGVLKHERLGVLWSDPRRKASECYAERLHPYFLRLMEKFDVSYRIDEETSLVGQLVPASRPDGIPWTRHDPRSPDMAELALVCRVEEDPPGLVPWLIVRNHRYNAARLHWQNGVFLQDAEHGQCLIELIDRELWISVRATYPAHLMSLLSDSVTHLIQQRWPGLRYSLTVPCPPECRNEPRRSGRLKLDVLRKRRADGKRVSECPDCGDDLSIEQLLHGFEWPRPDSSPQLEEIHALVSYNAQMVRTLLNAIGSETKECPRLFTLLPEEAGVLARVNPGSWGRMSFRLTLWCEMPDAQHPVCPIGSGGEGEYVFDGARSWLLRIAPLVRAVVQTLRYAIPIGGAVVKAGVDATLLKEIGPKIDVMEKAVTTLLKGEFDPRKGGHTEFQLRDYASGAHLRELRKLLKRVDPSEVWGGLRRVQVKTGDFLWLCPNHYRVFEPDLPVLPKADSHERSCRKG